MEHTNLNQEFLNLLYSCLLYTSGSNAFLLSSDLATLFTGRTFEIEVYPFSFKEYLKYYNYNDFQEAFDKYTQEGGMSGSYIYKTQEEKYQYISDVFNTLIIRDIKQKYNIKNTDVLNNLNNYLIDNISNLTSSNNITHFLNSNKVNICLLYTSWGRKSYIIR